MKFASICLILKICVSIAVLQIVQEVLEQIYPVLVDSADLKDGTDNLALHLSVN